MCERSPPVPQVSTTRIGTLTGIASSSITWTRPATSMAVSPLARSATTNAAICAGVASPVMISRIAHAVSVVVKECPLSKEPSSRGQDTR